MEERTNEITIAIADMWSTRIRQSIMHGHTTKDQAVAIIAEVRGTLGHRNEFMCNILREMVMGDSSLDVPVDEIQVIRADLQSMMEELEVREPDGLGSGPLDLVLHHRGKADHLYQMYHRSDISDQIQWRKDICQQVIANLES